MNIREAKPNDIEDILSVQSEVLLEENSNLSKEDLELKGFLKNKITKKELKNIFQGNSDCILLVAEEDNNITGYLLAYNFIDWSKSHKEWENKINLNVPKDKVINQKTLYYKHIASKRSVEGVGKKLHNRFIEIAKKKDYKRIIGEIMNEPYKNRLSEAFHKKLGYKRIGSIRYKDGTSWNLVIKKIQE